MVSTLHFFSSLALVVLTGIYPEGYLKPRFCAACERRRISGCRRKQVTAGNTSAFEGYFCATSTLFPFLEIHSGVTASAPSGKSISFLCCSQIQLFLEIRSSICNGSVSCRRKVRWDWESSWSRQFRYCFSCQRCDHSRVVCIERYQAPESNRHHEPFKWNQGTLLT